VTNPTKEVAISIRRKSQRTRGEETHTACLHDSPEDSDQRDPDTGSLENRGSADAGLPVGFLL
jgi:hypothetical protein